MTKTELLLKILQDEKSMLKKLAMKVVKAPEIADDVLQESAIKICMKGEQLKDEGHAAALAFVRQVVFNAARNEARTRRRIDASFDIENMSISGDTDHHGEMLYNQVITMIYAKIAALPETQQMVITKILANENSFMSELAAEIGMPYNTFKANWRHCCVKLKEDLNHLDPFDIIQERVVAFKRDEITEPKRMVGNF